MKRIRLTTTLSVALGSLCAAAAGLLCVPQGASAAASAVREVGAVLHLPGAKKICPNKLSAADAEAAILSDEDPYWRAALDASTSDDAEVAAVPLAVRRADVFTRSASPKKEIALTFDDGPHTLYTPELLRVLRRYNVPATFFVVGEMAEKAPDLIRDELKQGDVGNHTFHHVSLVKISPNEAEAEIQACDSVLRSITGKRPRLFRPPGGRFDAEIAAAATRMGYTTVLWTGDPADFTSPGIDVITERVIRTARPGGVLLLHDGIQQTIDALPRIIETLRSQGYSFVTVDQMLSERRPALMPLAIQAERSAPRIGASRG